MTSISRATLAALLGCLVFLVAPAKGRVETVQFQSKLVNGKLLATLMSEKKIPHEYRELPGDHSWGYWDKQIQEVLALASQKLRMPGGKTKTKI